MNCDAIREALSAHLDSEPLGMPIDAVNAHLDGCPACSAWLDSATRLTRLARIAPADAVPDLTADILAAAGPVGSAPPRAEPGPADPDPADPPAVAARATAPVPDPPAAAGLHAALAGRLLGPLRVALTLIAAVQAMLAWPAIMLGQDGMTEPLHVAHESGAWNLALAVAFLGVATRPSRAVALVPLLSVFVGVLAVVALPDLVLDHVGLARLAGHATVAGGLLLVWGIARTGGSPAAPPAEGSGSGTGPRPAGDPAAPGPVPLRPRRAFGSASVRTDPAHAPLPTVEGERRGSVA